MANTDGLERLKQDLKLKMPGSFYIFYGEEAYLREHYLDRLHKLLVDELVEVFNFRRFNADSLSPQALKEAVEGLPMMSERSMVQIDDVDLFARSEEERSAYAEILSDLPPHCTLVLVYDTVDFRVDKRKKALAKAMEKALPVEFTQPGERELAGWIARHFKSLKKTVTPELCRYLIRITGGSMTALHGEIGKIAAFAPEEQITRADVDAVVEPVLEAQVFDLTDAILNRRSETALQKLETLLQLQQEPVAILGAVSSQMRRILTARRLQAAGKGQKELMQLCGISGFPAAKALEFARQHSAGFCHRAVELCLEADVQLKTSFDAPERVLELLVLQLLQEASRG